MRLCHCTREMGLHLSPKEADERALDGESCLAAEPAPVWPQAFGGTAVSTLTVEVPALGGRHHRLPPGGAEDAVGSEKADAAGARRAWCQASSSVAACRGRKQPGCCGRRVPGRGFSGTGSQVCRTNSVDGWRWWLNKVNALERHGIVRLEMVNPVSALPGGRDLKTNTQTHTQSRLRTPLIVGTAGRPRRGRAPALRHRCRAQGCEPPGAGLRGPVSVPSAGVRALG